MTNAGRPTATDERLDRLETKTDRLETKVDQLETKVDRLETKVDQRFDEQRAHTNALFEASRADFNNLYDFVKAQAARTDARLDQIQAEAVVRAVDLQAAIAALAPRLRKAGRRR
jgi:predicted nuclease with TOPRIM domain